MCATPLPADESAERLMLGKILNKPQTTDVCLGSSSTARHNQRHVGFGTEGDQRADMTLGQFSAIRDILSECRKYVVGDQGTPDPFNSNSPTGSTFTAFSTFVSTRGLTSTASVHCETEHGVYYLPSYAERKEPGLVPT